jgi:hypothetical protein
MAMAEVGVAQKTGIIPEIEATQGSTRSFSVNGKITPDIINDLVKKHPEPMENDKFMGLLKSAVEEKPTTPSVPTVKIVPAVQPQKSSVEKPKEIKPTSTPSTAKELKRQMDEEWKKNKKKQEDWNQRHAPIGYFKK